MSTVRVLVVDDHPVVRGGVVGWLAAQDDFDVVGEASDGLEALANVRRHASANAVVLRVSRVGTADAGQVSVHVEDDGIGFDPATSPGVGLAGLRDRAEQVGGAVDVASAPGQGTQVILEVPLDAASPGGVP